MRCKAGRRSDRDTPSSSDSMESEVATMARTRPGAVVFAVAALTLAGCAGNAVNPEREVPPAHGPQLPPPPPVAPQPPFPQPPPEPPVQAPYPDVTYENPGVNPPLDPIFDGRSTFSLDVDTGAYAVARRYLADGFLPDPNSVRVEEFVNAFDGGYAAPVEDTFAISADGAPAQCYRSGWTFGPPFPPVPQAASAEKHGC